MVLYCWWHYIVDYEWEAKAKEYGVSYLRELAKETEWTEIDDVLVEKIAKSWGL